MKLFQQSALVGAIAIGLIGGTVGYALPASAQAAKQVPMRDFFKNPQEAGHQISPDGKYLSWLAPYERRQNVFVKPRNGGDIKRVTSETARDIGGYFWKGDRILYVKDFVAVGHVGAKYVEYFGVALVVRHDNVFIVIDQSVNNLCANFFARR